MVNCLSTILTTEFGETIPTHHEMVVGLSWEPLLNVQNFI